MAVEADGRPMTAADHTVTVITRVGCHLCEQAEQTVARMSAELGFAVEFVDVDSDPALANEYSDRVPVILLDGAEHGYWQVEEARLRQRLAR
jgi:glutaredoxin